MIQLYKEAISAESIAILGHVRPDGDCIGSCLGLYHYLKDQNPKARVQVYLEPFAEKFMFLEDADKISHDPEEAVAYDLCFVLDCSDEERIGAFAAYLKSAKRSICIDHHITNKGFVPNSLVRPEASAASEIIYSLIEPEHLTKTIAECLYMGIVHDTGVFKHSNTTKATMEAAGALLAYGINASYIIDHTFYEKTYLQNKVMGRVLLDSELFLNGKVIGAVVRKAAMEEYQVTAKDLDGIIDQLRITKGVEAAIFITEQEEKVCKASMRSNSVVNVAEIAAGFDGGGHIRAAGCTMKCDAKEALMLLTEKVKEQLSWTE